jgi:peptidoglycan/LPS O-acetylase OafA/YrhL
VDAPVPALAVLAVTFVISDSTFRFIIRYSLQGAALFILFSYVLSERSTLLNNVLTSPPMIWIGLVSYSLYLCHFAIFKTLQLHSSLNPVTIGVAGTLLVFAYGFLTRKFVEVPILKWRRKRAAAQRALTNTETSTERELAASTIGPECEPATTRSR